MSPNLTGFHFVSLLLLLVTTSAVFVQPQLPEEFVIKVLSDEYLRSPAVILVENNRKVLDRFEKVWSKVKLSGFDIVISTFNSSGLGRLLEATSYDQVNEMIKHLRSIVRINPSGGRVFTAVAQVSRIMPFDSSILVLTADAPHDKEAATLATQALIHKRCKLFVMWLEGDSVPELFSNVTQLTGGSVLETEWPEDNEAEEIQDLETISQPQEKPSLYPEEVLVEVRRGVRGKISMPFYIDPSIMDICITTTGRANNVLLHHPSGEVIEVTNSTEGQRVPTEDGEGTWYLEASGTIYDVTVQASSRLAYDAILEKHYHTISNGSSGEEDDGEQENTRISSGNKVRLRRIRGDGKLDSVVLVDETGKELAQLKQLSGIEHDYEPDYEEANDTEWQIPDNKLPAKQYFVRLSGKDSNGDQFMRLSALSLDDNGLLQPVTVELNERTQLVVQQGQTVQMFFDVTNYYFRPLEMIFYTQDEQGFIKNINPKRQFVYPQTKIEVMVFLEVHGNSRDRDIVSMTAESIVGPVTGKAYLYVGYNQDQEDTGTPDITINTDGYCRDYLSPTVCYSRYWSIDAIIKSSNGLLRIRSVPLGLQYRTEFIAGTKETVRAHYTSTCCNSKVEIIATDVYGNIKSRTVDIERVWLTAGEITAIVLGSVLILLLLILLIVAIVLCVRRRRHRNFLMHR